MWGGQYRVQPLATKLEFGRNDVPTKASAQALIKELANMEQVSPDTVSIAYFKTSDAETVALDAYLKSYAQFSKGGWAWCSLYVVGFNDCVAFANNALAKAGIGRGSEALDFPNWEYLYFLMGIADATYPKQKDDPEKDRQPSHQHCLQDRDGHCIE